MRLYLSWWCSISVEGIRLHCLSFPKGFLCWILLFVRLRLFYARISSRFCCVQDRRFINLLVGRLLCLLFVLELRLCNLLLLVILHNQEIYKNILFLNILEYHAQFRLEVTLRCLGFQDTRFHYQEEALYI
jgi:hypothetical protein